MKRIIFVFFVFTFSVVLTGCSFITDDTTSAGSKYDGGIVHLYDTLDLQWTEDFGDLPDEFKDIVSENRFYNFKYNGGKYFRILNNGISMYDLRGTPLGACSSGDDYMSVECYCATSDGGFLVSFGRLFRDDSDDVFSCIVKCSEKGEVEWKYKASGYSCDMFEYCTEKDGAYYFFGDNSMTSGLTDIYALKISCDGRIITSKKLSYGDFDRLMFFEMIDDQFVLCDMVIPADGLTHLSNLKSFRTLVLDDDLSVISTDRSESEPERVQSAVLGILDGKEIHANDMRSHSNEYGAVSSVMDYGDFFLVVSNHVVGNDSELSNAKSSVRNIYETVYAAYGKDGTLLWLRAVPVYKTFTKVWQE